jgi:myo-inositol-hexaphosphate 3-phosphohydrolase
VELFRFIGGADGTDGLDVESTPLGPEFPDGLLVAMNSASHNFLFYRWADVVRAARQ